MFSPGEFAIVLANKEMLEDVGAEQQLTEGQKVKVIKTFPDNWIVVEGSFLGVVCHADVPSHFLKKV
jgi:hypothetical protein